MPGPSEQLTGCVHERVGLVPQVAATALLDFGCALGQSYRKGIGFRAYFGVRVQANDMLPIAR